MILCRSGLFVAHQVASPLTVKVVARAPHKTHASRGRRSSGRSGRARRGWGVPFLCQRLDQPGSSTCGRFARIGVSDVASEAAAAHWQGTLLAALEEADGGIDARRSARNAAVGPRPRRSAKRMCIGQAAAYLLAQKAAKRLSQGSFYPADHISRVVREIRLVAPELARRARELV